MRRLSYAVLVLLGGSLPGVVSAGLPQFATASLNNVDVGRESKPAVVDIDKDGDFDIFIGTQDGRIIFYRNQGTYERPNFLLAAGKENPLDGFDVGQSAAPVFVDIDKDGDFDAFIGEWGGSIKYYQNDGTAQHAKFTEHGERDFANPFRSIDVGRFSMPSFVDIDNDGDLDAFIGNWDDKLEFYRNTGTAFKPIFDYVDEKDNPFHGLELGEGLAPVFADWDKDGDQDAQLGMWNGRVKYLRNVGSAEVPEFRPAAGTANPLFRVRLQRAVAPALVDIDLDGDLDAFVGEDSGMIHYYHNNGRADAPDIYGIDRKPEAFSTVEVSDKVALTLVDLDGDADLDLLVGERYQPYRYYRNEGSETEPKFTLVAEEQSPFRGIVVAGNAPPAFVDIDNDYDLDLFLGLYDGTVAFYRNEGTRSTPKFDEVSYGNPLRKFDAGNNAVPAFADMDGDGDYDVLIGDRAGKHLYLENRGKPDDPKFRQVTGEKDPFDRFEFGPHFTPLFGDPDSDGDYDLLYGTENGTVGYYRNFAVENRHPEQPAFKLRSETDVLDDTENPYAHLGAGGDSSLALADLDGDGDMDLTIAAADGVIQFYENTDPAPAARNDHTLCAKDQYKITQPVVDNDRFKRGHPAQDFHISSYDLNSAHNGTVELDRDTGTFTYSPRPGFLGEDSFLYTLSDGKGISDTAKVVVNVVVDETPPRMIFNQKQLINAETIDGIDSRNVAIRALLREIYALDDVDGRINRIHYKMPDHLPMGDTVVTFIVADLTGNRLDYPVTFSVADREGPELTQPDNLFWPVANVEPVAVATMGIEEFINSVKAVDKIDGPISQISNDLPEYLLPGDTTVTFSATDRAGNVSTVTATISLGDKAAPTIEVPSSLVIPNVDQAGLPANDERITSFIASVTASDNVGVASFENDAPDHFPQGNTTITFTARDAAGNETVVQATVVLMP